MIKHKKAKIFLLISSILAIPTVITIPIIIILKNKNQSQINDKTPSESESIKPVLPTIKPNPEPTPNNKPEKETEEDSNEIRLDVLNKLNKEFENRINTIIDTINLLNSQKEKNDKLKEKIENEKQKLQKDINNLQAHTKQDGFEFTLITDQLQHQINSYQKAIEDYNNEIERLNIDIHTHLQNKAKLEQESNKNIVKVNYLKQELENLNIEITKIQQEKEQKIKELANRQNHDQSTLSHLQNQLNDLISSETSFSVKISEYEAKIANIQTNIANEQEKIDQQNRDIIDKEQEKRKLESNLKEQTTIRINRLNNIKQLISQIVEIENQLRR
ncbi:hypothetical protein [Mycoplasma capricolum]|uniref:hypothetical protein n=1 Tax=Mycoplasma capricolum TaxID=2095 RepID=UPI003DA348DD